jgi:hypothetical protein
MARGAQCARLLAADGGGGLGAQRVALRGTSHGASARWCGGVVLLSRLQGGAVAYVARRARASSAGAAVWKPASAHGVSRCVAPRGATPCSGAAAPRSADGGVGASEGAPTERRRRASASAPRARNAIARERDTRSDHAQRGFTVLVCGTDGGARNAAAEGACEMLSWRASEKKAR